MKKKKSFKQMTLDDRLTIERMLREGSNLADIAKATGRSKSTVSREIEIHRVPTHKCALNAECAAYRDCALRRICRPGCPGFEPFRCARRDRSPKVCTGCPKHATCRFDKYKYDATLAHNAYREQLVGSRQGYDITPEEAKAIGEAIAPLINEQGHSPYAVAANEDVALPFTERTLYNYISGGVFRAQGLIDVSLRRKTSRRMPKASRKVLFKPRKDNAVFAGRTYEDFQRYKADNPGAGVVLMDTVYNDVADGPFIQTFKFDGLGAMFAVLHRKRDAASMREGVRVLRDALGEALFGKYCGVILTDRGVEFSDAEGIEALGCKLFYCDPMCSWQKGSLENNHEEIRYALPKGEDLRALGLESQSDLNLVISHVDSYPKQKLGGRSAFEFLEFLAPELAEKLYAFGLRKIPKSEVNLTKSLLRKKGK